MPTPRSAHLLNQGNSRFLLEQRIHHLAEGYALLRPTFSQVGFDIGVQVARQTQLRVGVSAIQGIEGEPTDLLIQIMADRAGHTLRMEIDESPFVLY